MSATNKTTHYELPVFVGGDMPAWLTDFNGAMNTIDAGIYQAKTAGDGAQASADTANANIVTLSGTVDGIGGRLTTLEGTVSSQGGNIDTINSLIGNGEPTTTDKTIIGAINELAAEIPQPGSIDADDVSYSNTTSGLTATDVQAAIDELETEIQAIQPGGGYDLDLSAFSGAMTITSTYTVGGADSIVNYLLNADKSVGKIYGGVYITGPIALTANTWTTIATLSAADMPTISAAYNIEIGFSQVSYSGGISVNLTRLHFNTDGTIDIQLFSSVGSTDNNVAVNLVPCLYFLKDLGD